MTSIPCDIVLLPSPELEQKAFALSRHLQKFGTLYVLKDDECFPHASLYMTQLKIDDLENARQLLREIAGTTSVFDLVATGYHQAEGYIDVEFERTRILEKLQQQIITAINPIRDGMREKDRVRMLSATGQVRENLEKYGYRGVGDLFVPHLSITRFTNSQAIATDDLPSFDEFSAPFNRLGLFEMGDNGTCIRKICELRFGQ